ncbi:hypothetical protein [Pseudoxanthomonas sp. 10H]|uniref:hypothetical protein n=1 Tax=Pseudoxanthomonas sp. 10H TaxID=3242729 RepID=UPI0035571C7B
MPDPLVRPHERYCALGDNEDARRNAYRALVVAGLADAEVEHIRATLQRQHALGNDRFRDAIERQLGRRAGPARIGRPPKPRDSEESAL